MYVILMVDTGLCVDGDLKLTQDLALPMTLSDFEVKLHTHTLTHTQLGPAVHCRHPHYQFDVIEQLKVVKCSTSSQKARRS